jgi:DNA-binding winged helix-turn-helix (wHTH) protein
VYLAERANQVISREHLFEALWSGALVGDHTLTQVVIKLRKALGDDAKSGGYIQTISKKGYRLRAPVRAVPPTGRGIRPPGLVPTRQYPSDGW